MWDVHGGGCGRRSVRGGVGPRLWEREAPCHVHFRVVPAIPHPMHTLSQVAEAAASKSSTAQYTHSPYTAITAPAVRLMTQPGQAPWEHDPEEFEQQAILGVHDPFVHLNYPPEMTLFPSSFYIPQGYPMYPMNPVMPQAPHFGMVPDQFGMLPDPFFAGPEVYPMECYQPVQ